MSWSQATATRASHTWLTGAATYDIPRGDAFEIADAHLGVRLTGGVPWAAALAVALTFQYQPLEIAALGTQTVKKYLVGFHYLDDVSARVTIYGSYDLGAYRTETTGDSFGDAGETRAVSTKLGMAGAFGTVYWATPQLGVDLSIRIDQTSAAIEPTGPSRSGYLFGIHAGMRIAP